ncbi:MAG: peptidase S8/S53 subtilisin kexin sedolisin, partial [Candidatus Berkelbacteria bacterium Licking1014_96]
MRRKVKIIVGLLVVLLLVITAGFMTKKWWAGADVDLANQQKKAKKLEDFNNKPPLNYIPGEIIIKVKDNLIDTPASSISSLTALNNKYQVEIVPLTDEEGRERTQGIGFEGTYKLKIGQANQTEMAVAEYKKDPNLQFAEPNYLYQISNNLVDSITQTKRPNDPYFKSSNSWDQQFQDQWNLYNINLPKAWPLSTGENTAVAVIDTGADLAHEDLKDKIINPKDMVDVDISQLPTNCRAVPGEDYTQPDNEVDDIVGHGTHVSGIIAATTNNKTGIAGIGWKTKIIPIKTGFAIECDAGGGQYERIGLLTNENLNRAIRYAANKNTKIINLSLGGPYSY